VSENLSLRNVFIALCVLSMAACGGADEESTVLGQTSQSDADGSSVTFSDADLTEPDQIASPPDSATTADVQVDGTGSQEDSGPPPECTEETSWKCEDGNICTEDSCTDGACINAPIEGCCKTAEDCDDGVPCTIDECNPTKSECLHSFETNKCCITVDDCAEADLCDVALCAGHQCVYPVADPGPDCACSKNLDCSDGSACTDDLCLDGACVYELSGAAGCCTADQDCDDADAVTADQCQAGVCWNGPSQCAIDADCTGPNACASGSCVEGACSYPSGCCLLDSECDDAQDATIDRCIEGSCVSSLDENAEEC